jgi:hypothetical protein
MKPVSYIDRICNSDEFRRLAVKAERYWEGNFRAPTVEMIRAHAIETQIKINHEGNRP